MYKNVKYVLKQDGTYEDYDISKIQESVVSVLKDVNEYNEQSQFLISNAKKISFNVSDKISDVLKIESKEDYVRTNVIYEYTCDELFSIGYNRTARKFINDRYNNIIAEKDKIISSLKNELKLYKGDDYE